MKWSEFDGHMSSATGFPTGDYSALRGLSAVSVFELIFSDQIFDLLSEESTRYALFLNCPDPKITKEEFKTFLGILTVLVDTTFFLVNVSIGKHLVT